MMIHLNLGSMNSLLKVQTLKNRTIGILKLTKKMQKIMMNLLLWNIQNNNQIILYFKIKFLQCTKIRLNKPNIISCLFQLNSSVKNKVVQ